MTVRSERAVRPWRPMTRPRSCGLTRTSSSSPRRSERLVTVTSSGWSTMPRTRWSRASASIGLALGGGLLGGGLGCLLGRALSVVRLRGRGSLGGLRLALLCLVLRGLDRLRAFLGGGFLVGFLLAQRAFGAREPLDRLPVAGDLQQGQHLFGGLGSYRKPVLRTLGVDVDERGLFGGVVLTDLFDRPTIALLAAVDDDDAVVRRADLAHALEPDFDCHCGGNSWFGEVARGLTRWVRVRGKAGTRQRPVRGARRRRVQLVIVPEDSGAWHVARDAAFVTVLPRAASVRPWRIPRDLGA